MTASELFAGICGSFTFGLSSGSFRGSSLSGWSLGGFGKRSFRDRTFRCFGDRGFGGGSSGRRPFNSFCFGGGRRGRHQESCACLRRCGCVYRRQESSAVVSAALAVRLNCFTKLATASVG